VVFDPQLIETVAEATGEIAKTTNTAIVAASSLGSVIRGPVDEIIGIVQDRLRVVRWERQQALSDRVAAVMKRRGLHAPTRDLPINFAVPLLTAAIPEEDDELQEAWARLLVNAGDAATEMELRTAYVEILRGMSGFDVRNLSTLAQTQLSAPTGQFGFISAVDLPHSANWFRSGSADTIPDEVAISLGNLSRLGCVVPAAGFGGGYNFAMVLVTELGIAMYRACS
jgi:hypothetical protein